MNFFCLSPPSLFWLWLTLFRVLFLFFWNIIPCKQKPVQLCLHLLGYRHLVVDPLQGNVHDGQSMLGRGEFLGVINDGTEGLQDLASIQHNWGGLLAPFQCKATVVIVPIAVTLQELDEEFPLWDRHVLVGKEDILVFEQVHAIGG